MEIEVWVHPEDLGNEALSRLSPCTLKIDKRCQRGIAVVTEADTTRYLLTGDLRAQGFTFEFLTDTEANPRELAVSVLAA